MLLQALVACAGVTVDAVAKDVPIGFKQIRIHISLNSDASSTTKHFAKTLPIGHRLLGHKGCENLLPLRDNLASTCDNCLTVQQ